MDALEDAVLLQGEEELNYKLEPDASHNPLPATETGSTEI